MKFIIDDFILNLREKAHRILIPSFVFILLTTFFSCNNILDTNKENSSKLSYTGESYILEGRLAPKDETKLSEEARIAYPLITESEIADENNYRYKIYLDGVLLENVSVEANVFSLTLHEGNNTVKVEAEKKEISGTPGDPAYSEQWNLILKSQKTITIAAGSPRVLSAQFDLTKIQDNGTYGKVKLKMDLPSEITYVTATLIGTELKSKWQDALGLTGSTVVKACEIDGTTAYFPAKDDETQMPSGSYKVQFNFYDNSTTKTILYSRDETVEVYQNLLTDKWHEIMTTGSSSPVNNSSNDFSLTTQLIKEFNDSTVYVSSSGSDTGSGTYYGKFRTLQKAVDAVVAKNNVDQKEYNIYLCSNISGETIDLSESNKKLKLNISSDSDTQRTIAGKSNASVPLIKIVGKDKTNSVISFNNIKLTGHTNSSKTYLGGAAYVNNATLTFTNCNISSNYAVKGAGVYCDTGAALIADSGTSISSNTASRGSASDNKGGGIYAAGDVTVKCSMSSNTTSGGEGGAIYVSSDTNAKLKFEGAAEVSGEKTSMTNDVYLSDGKKIIPGSTLSKSTVAYITPQAPAKNLQVLDSDSAKFTTSFEVDSFSISGNKLVLANKVTNIYVTPATTCDQPSGPTTSYSAWKHYNSTSTYQKNNPFKTLDDALRFITWQGENEDYTITITGTLKGAQKIANSTTSGYPITLTKGTNIKTLTLTGSDANATLDNEKVSNRTTLAVDTSVPVIITTLKIKGGKNSDSSTGKGGGIYISSSSTVSLAGGAQVTDNLAYYGGGVYNEGTLYIYGSAAVGDTGDGDATQSSGNFANLQGGGIYSTGNLYLGYDSTGQANGLTYGVKRNYAPYGGGVYFNGSGKDFKFNTGVINYNYATYGGGGVYLYAAQKLELTGTATINYNKTKGEGGSCGAGIYVGDVSVDMKDSSQISHNSNVDQGGGVYVSCTSPRQFVMSGGAVASNTATKGGAVFINSTLHESFALSGSASVLSYGTKGSNDIYTNGASVKIDSGDFVPAGDTKAIWITPNVYNNEKLVIDNPDDNVIGKTYKYFNVTKASTSSAYPEWAVGSNGKLFQACVVTGSGMNLTDGSSYNLVASSSCSSTSLDNFLFNLCCYVEGETAPPTLGSNTTLDLSRVSLEKFTTYHYSEVQIAQPIKKVILPADTPSDFFENSYIHYYFSGVQEFEIAGSSNTISIYDNAVYNKNKTKLLCYPGAKNGFSLYSGASEIGAYACYATKGLTSVVIPNSVSSVGEYAFSRVLSMTSIQFSNTMTVIPKCCCFMSYNLKTVKLSSSITKISESAFFRAIINNSDFSLPGSLEEIGMNAFQNGFAYNSTLTVSIPTSVTKFGYGAFTGIPAAVTINMQNKSGWKKSSAEDGTYTSVSSSDLTSDNLKSTSSLGGYWLKKN